MGRKHDSKKEDVRNFTSLGRECTLDHKDDPEVKRTEVPQPNLSQTIPLVMAR